MSGGFPLGRRGGACILLLLLRPAVLVDIILDICIAFAFGGGTTSCILDLLLYFLAVFIRGLCLGRNLGGGGGGGWG